MTQDPIGRAASRRLHPLHGLDAEEAQSRLHDGAGARAEHEAAGLHGGVFAKGGGLVHIALFEANAMAVFEINCRNNNH